MTNEKYYKTIIESALEIGERRASKLQEHQRMLELYGLLGLRTKHFLNSLLSNGKFTYVELGVYRGASLTCALWDNPEIKAYGVDDWHYSPIDHPAIKLDDKGKTIPWQNVKLAAEANLKSYKIDNAKLISKNWIDLKKSDIAEPIDIIHIQPVPGVTEPELTAILNSVYPLIQTTSVVLAELYKENHIRKVYADWIKNKNLNLDSIQTKASDNLSNGDHWWGGLGAMVLTKKDITK